MIKAFFNEIYNLWQTSKKTQSQIASLQESLYHHIRLTSQSQKEYDNKLQDLHRRVDEIWQTNLSILNNQSEAEAILKEKLERVEYMFEALCAQREAQGRGGSGIIINQILNTIMDDPPQTIDAQKLRRTRTREKLL